MKRNGNNRAMMASKTRIPEGWRLVRLGDMADVLDARRIPLNAEDRSKMPGEYPYYGANGVIDFIDRWIFDEDDDLVLLAEDGGHFDEFRNRPIAFRVEGKCWVNNHAHVLKATTCTVGGFLFHSLVNKDIRLYINGTTRSKLTQADLLQVEVSLPPLPEQRAIAAVLDSIDDSIERTDAVIAATEQLRDSLLHVLLTRGVPGWHTKWKDVPGLGTIPADWEVVRLEEVAKVERGKFAHRPRNEPRFYGGDVPFIQTGDVVRADGRIKEHSQTLNQLGMSISRLFPAGTIVLTIAANIGETAIAEYPVAFPDSLVGVIPRRVNTNFLEYFLRTQKSRLNHFAPESAQKNINLDDLRPLLTPLPSSQEQHSIASCIDEVAETLAQVQQERERLSAMKDSTADALLTGRVRVI